MVFFGIPLFESDVFRLLFYLFSRVLTVVDSQFFYFFVFSCVLVCGCGSLVAGAFADVGVGLSVTEHSAIRHALVDISCTSSCLWFFLYFSGLFGSFLIFHFEPRSPPVRSWNSI